MRPRWLPPTVLLGVLAVWVAATWFVTDVLWTPKEPREQKIAAADAVLYYRVGPNSGPRFPLLGAERTLRLISHAAFPPEARADEHLSIRYGLRLELVAESGETVWQHDLYTQSRRSRADRQGDLWRRENAFTGDAGMALSDDRVFLVDLPADVPDAAELRVLLAPVGADASGAVAARMAFVRLYERAPRAPLGRFLRALTLSPESRDALAERATYTSWSQLRSEDIEHLLTHAHLRRPALGQVHLDYDIQRIYYTGFRLPAPQPAAASRPELVASQAAAVALNAQGPAQLRFDFPAQAAAHPEAVLQIVRVGAAGDPEWTEMALDTANAPSHKPYVVPAGLHSLHISASTPEPVRFVVTTPPPRVVQFGDKPPHATAQGLLLLPDRRRLAGYLTGPGLAPVRAGLEEASDIFSRVLRVDVFPLFSAGDDPAASGGAELDLEVQDAHGQTIRHETRPIAAARRSLFETVQDGAGQWYAAGEPESFRMLLPPDGREIELAARDAVFVRLSTMLPPDERRCGFVAPYGDVLLEGVEWRYAPVDDCPWAPLRAANHAALSAEGQTGRLWAQVRLEPLGERIELAEQETRREPARQGHALTPLEPVMPERLVEPVADGLHAMAEWQAQHALQLVPNRPWRILFPERLPAPAELTYWVVAGAQALLGQSVVLRLDGRDLARLRIDTTHGRWTLPAGIVGRHIVELRAPQRGLRLLLDRPPVSPRHAERVFAVRTAYRFDRPLRVRVDKPSERPVTLNVVVYAPRADADPAVRFRVAFEPGRPTRFEGRSVTRLSFPERVVTLPPASGDGPASLADRRGRVAGYRRTLTVVLGVDIVPGRHTLRIEPQGTEDLWVRFFVLGASMDRAESALQWRSTAPASED